MKHEPTLADAFAMLTDQRLIEVAQWPTFRGNPIAAAALEWELARRRSQCQDGTGDLRFPVLAALPGGH